MVQCHYPHVYFLHEDMETKKLSTKTKKITQLMKVRLKPRLSKSFINIPEKCRKRIKQYTMWETQSMFDLSNLNIFEASNGALEHAVFLVSCLNF